MMKKLSILFCLVVLTATLSLADTRKTKAECFVLLQDGQAADSISEEDVRDCFEYGYEHVTAHDTSCPGVTGGVQNDVCWERDANTVYVCETATCEGAGWTQIATISGNAATATALAANGANCAANEFNKGVDASGAAESCAALVDADVPNDITITLAATATALAANGANCAANEFNKGVDASGAAESCAALVDADVPDDITVDLAATATALAANGANCAAGNYPLGVDASGAVEDCTAAGGGSSPTRNAQTGTTYTFVAADDGKVVTFSNASAVAVTLPQATGDFDDGWFVYTENVGAGLVTITPTTSTVNGRASITLGKNERIVLFSDGTNYLAWLDSFYRGDVDEILIGREAGLLLSTSTIGNVLIGNDVLEDNNSTGSHANTMIGYQVASQGGTTATSSNTVIGYLAGLSLNGGIENVLIGRDAGPAIVGGDNNVSIGTDSGQALNSASGSIFLGNKAGLDETGSNTLIIDNADRGSEAAGRTDSLIYGVMNATPASQTLALNAAVDAVHGLEIGGIRAGNPNRNAQTGTTYTFLAGDSGKLVTFSNAAAIAVTLPQATGDFDDGWFVYAQSLGAGLVTITPTTSTINGAATIDVGPNERLIIFSDGTDYLAWTLPVRNPSKNVLIGQGAGELLPAGAEKNVILGQDAVDGTSNAGVDNNVIIGNAAAGTTSGSFASNVIVGTDAAIRVSGALSNVIIGSTAAQQLTGGDDNTVIGPWTATVGLTTGSSNIFIGHDAAYDETGSNTLIIDNADRGSEAAGRTDSLIYGIMSATAADQTLTLNASVSISETLTVDQDAIASATTLALGNGNFFTVSGTTNITTMNTCDATNDGRHVTLIFSGILTFTDGNNLKLAGDLVTSADDTISLICDGSNWFETARSVN
jgi:hypothetical protein